MTRRWLFQSMMALGIPSEVPHYHLYDKSPFYVMASISYEEPGFYPPSGMIPIEICKCGAMRINPSLADKSFRKDRL